MKGSRPIKEKSALRPYRSQGLSLTDPDCPPVAAMSSDDIPLKVKSREKLPARNVAFELAIFCKGEKIGDSQKDTIHNEPKLQKCNLRI